jgi:hypothetical protein
MQWLREQPMYRRRKGNRRKPRLFACASARTNWDRLNDPRSKQAVEISERFADGMATLNDLSEARDAARDAVGAGDPEFAAYWASAGNGWEAAWEIVPSALCAAMKALGRDVIPARQWLHCELLRDIFGNPFRPVAVDPSWLTWNHATVPAIARHIYDDRAFHDMPILADALQDAGCTNDDLLDHCRGPGPHVRGCWAVDLLLGKA